MTTLTPPRLHNETHTNHGFAKHFKVLLHNDEKTPFLFVWDDICTGIFKLSREQAYILTHEIHTTGIGLAGVFVQEQAEFKCEQVTSLARGRGYPLQATCEPE